MASNQAFSATLLPQQWKERKKCNIYETMAEKQALFCHL
jgi:hypothetical protein